MNLYYTNYFFQKLKKPNTIIAHHKNTIKQTQLKTGAAHKSLKNIMSI